MNKPSIHPLRFSPAIGALLVLALASPAAGGHAPCPVCASTDSGGIVQTLDDAQLAAVAGKFTLAGQIVGMRLDMASSWQATNGERLEAAAGIEIALPGSGHDGIRFDARAAAIEGKDGTGASADRAATGTVHLGHGLRSVRGIGQVIQVAGDANDAANHARIHITRAPLPAGAANGRTHAAASGTDGARASVDIGAQGVALNLTLPGAGQASQRLDAAGAGMLGQHIQIATHGQQVVNRMQLELQTLPATRAAIATHGMDSALKLLRAQ